VLLAVGIVCAMIAAMALAVLLADRRRERGDGASSGTVILI
jgi:hypothetical protein